MGVPRDGAAVDSITRALDQLYHSKWFRLPWASSPKRIFLSSTVYDLKPLRWRIRSFLETTTVPGVRLECVTSETPDFLVPPRARASRHSYDICIDRLSACDYAIVLIDAKYGAPIIVDDGSEISITHLEYRTTVRRCMPRFIFVSQATWDARNAFRKGLSQSHVSAKHLGVFDFVDEIHKSRTNWISFYEDVDDILLTLKTNLLTLDDSDFVSDLGVADGDSVKLGTRFTKTWQIRNNGMVAWKNRRLCEENPGASGLIPDQPCVPIPDTMPGQIATISVEFTAPDYSATCKSIWRMRDENNQHCLPNKIGIWCKIYASHR